MITTRTLPAAPVCANDAENHFRICRLEREKRTHDE